MAATTTMQKSVSPTATTPMQIPLFKVHLPPPELLMPRLQSVLYSGHIAEGEVVKQFEQAFGAYVQNQHALSFHSGTAALHTALLLAGVQRDDEVISTPMTAEPTNVAVMQTGAKLVWADVEPDTGNISAESVAARITPRTKAIVVVHYGGFPVNISAIRSAAERWGVPVIEDAAHALGARYDGRPIGGHSEYVMFSFQAIKHLTTVDGGMLTCRNEAELPLGRRLRWFGIDRAASRLTVDIREVGYKYHMNNVTAAIGLAQMEVIDSVIARHIANGKFYDEQLAGIPGIRVCAPAPDSEPSYWLYTVLAERRDDLKRLLAERGIDSGQVHRRNDQHSVFATAKTDLPGLDKFWETMLHIPCGWWVTDEQREYIVDCIRGGW